MILDVRTLTKSLKAIQMRDRAGYTAIVSHRSGETEDIKRPPEVPAVYISGLGRN